jgi:GxxExxY protein
MNAELKHFELTEKLISIYYSLYNELGYGFLESIYQKAFALMLQERKLSFQQQSPVRVMFHGVELGDFFADLLVESAVLVELKAVRALEQAHERQLLNYLRATDIEVGLLFNFGPKPQFRRLAFDNSRKGQGAQAASQSAGSGF